MEAGSTARKLVTIFLGILVAYFCASGLSQAVVVLFHLTGAAGMMVSFVLFAVFFFAILRLLQNYAGIVFFGFDRE